MTMTELINMALKKIVEPAVKEHVRYMKRMHKLMNDSSMQRERLDELRWRGE